MKLFSSLAVLGLFAGAALGFAADEKKAELKCPVSGATAKTENSRDFNGGKVYFCCDKCPASFDAKKHGTKANAQLVATGQAKQAKCPISGAKLNPDTAITVAGAKVAFCCEKCQGKVKDATGDDQIALVFGEEAFKKAGFAVEKKK